MARTGREARMSSFICGRVGARDSARRTRFGVSARSQQHHRSIRETFDFTGKQAGVTAVQLPRSLRTSAVTMSESESDDALSSKVGASYPATVSSSRSPLSDDSMNRS